MQAATITSTSSNCPSWNLDLVVLQPVLYFVEVGARVIFEELDESLHSRATFCWVAVSSGKGFIADESRRADVGDGGQDAYPLDLKWRRLADKNI